MPTLLNLATGQTEPSSGAPDLVLEHDTNILSEAPNLEGVKIIAVELPKFKDGRAFTQVRVLRDRYGFDGEIRVTGHVIPDQAAMLARVGGTTVELADDALWVESRASA